MASTARTKRLAREVPELRKKNANYFVNINDQDLTSFEAYIVGPDDSCYAGKLVKLKIEVPRDYPFKPPKCTFIQQKGGRIHPNLYNQGGKVCLSILGTWEGPGWALTMTIDTVLITIQSLLDSKPAMHEPGKPDTKSYNDYVRYTTWRWLLLDYIDSETDVASKTFLQSYLKEQGSRIWQQLQNDKKAMGNIKSVTSFYGGGGQSQSVTVDWLKLENDVRSAIVKAGGSTSGTVLSFGQLSSDSSATITPVNASPTTPAVESSPQKRKLDSVDESSTRPAVAKKSSTQAKEVIVINDE